MSELLEHKIQALNYWQNSETHIPRCSHCDKEIGWGDGFIVESIFLCNPCGERLHPSNWIKKIQSSKGKLTKTFTKKGYGL
ncbi:MAG: hypothetical protein ACE5J5_01490 [Candidatus Hydrothermarchaeales archaeon]